MRRVLTIDIPENILSEATVRGVPIEVIVRERLAQTSDFASRPGFKRFGIGSETARQAAADIRDLRAQQTLGADLTIQKLVEEGRRT